MPFWPLSWGSVRGAKRTVDAYAWAVIFAGMAFVAEWLCWSWLANSALILCALAALVSLLYGGIGPALVTAVTSGVAINYAFLMKDGNHPIAATALRITILTSIVLVASVIDTAYRQEKAAREARDHLIQMVSHDLRTPLTSAMFGIALIARKLPSELIPHVKKVERALQRQVRLLERVLDTTKLLNNQIRLVREDTRIDLIIQQVIEEMQVQFEAQHVEIHSTLDPVSAWIDADKIEQVVANLLSNALKYGDNKPVDISLHVNGEITISVHDNGHGISKEDLKSIFERFVRVGDAWQHSGHGLGLWITKHLVRLHGGNIEVESEPNLGTTFIVKLPDGRLD